MNDSQFQLLITTVDLRIVVQIANGKSQIVNDNACEVSVCRHSISPPFLVWNITRHSRHGPMDGGCVIWWLLSLSQLSAPL